MDAEIDELPAPPREIPLGGVRKWLWCVAALVFFMIMLGGLTRLTDSGLSITVWDPVMGTIPPLSDADWIKAFDLYKQTTEFKVQNSAMMLPEFKSIFWWEWSHRFLGRFIGVAFAVPFLIFLAMRRLSTGLVISLVVLFIIGGAQGALGWYMVQSGLADRVDVSQYRLAAHLALASLLFAATIWIVLGVGRKRSMNWSGNALLSILLLLLMLLQIAAGGFVAGLDAGHASDEWPKMHGLWIPAGLDTLKPVWMNAFENALAVQFNHRMLAYLLLVISVIHAWSSFRFSSMVFAYAVFAQVCLGVLTVIMRVPMGFALVHQATAMLVLALAVANLHAYMINRSLASDPQLYRQRLQSQ
jgi:heme a synthase